MKETCIESTINGKISGDRRKSLRLRKNRSVLFIDLFVVIKESEDVGINEASCKFVSVVYYLLQLLDLSLHLFLLKLASFVSRAELRLQLCDFAGHLL